MAEALQPKVLVVDDELGTQESLKMILKSDYHVFSAPSGEEAFRLIDQESPDVVLLDVLLPGVDGLEVLRKMRSLNPDLQVIMLTGQERVRTAVDAMKLGAFDYLHKPFEIEELRDVVRRALDQRRQKEEIEGLKEEARKAHQFDHMVGACSKMRVVFQAIHRVMNSASNVLITGESGTGKELVARAVHYYGNRKDQPFVVIHAASIPEKLLESELFGHEKGAFTGAHQTKHGTVEMADGGTLFLDEIGEMPLELQAKLLRVIQEKEFRRVGGTQTIKVDVRYVAATNKNLEKAVSDGKFREDLFYRISVVPIVLPSLRERKEDIPLLIYHFLDKFRATSRTSLEGVSDETMKALKSYDWPGNVRELQNVIENLGVLVNRPMIQIEDLPQRIRMNHLQRSIFDYNVTGGSNLESIVAVFERQIIEEALKKCNGIYTRAAKLLGTTRRILKYRIDQLKIPSIKNSNPSPSEAI